MERNSDMPAMDGESEPEGEDEDEFGEHVVEADSNKISLVLSDTEDNEENGEEQPRDITTVFDSMQLSITEIMNLKDGDDLSSTEKATLLLSKLIHPIDPQTFYKNNWEKSALLSARENDDFFKKIITRKVLEGVFSKQLLFEGVNVSFVDPLKIAVSNVPMAEDDENEDNDNTSDAESDADEEAPAKEVRSSEIWQNYNNGQTVKLLTPQVYIDNIWKLLSVLEHEFQSRVSAEVVLAPPLERQTKSAPAQARPGSVAAKLNSDDKNKVKAHVSAVPYDNVNAFVLQLEGQSRWRVMPNPHTKLNLATDGGAVALKDIDDWSKPVIDTILTPGDSLYIPKGWVYQQDNHGTNATSDPASQHSLHLKLCCTHGTTGTTGDLLHLLVPEALGEAVQSHVALRSALPKGYHKHLGLAASEVENDKKRARLQKHIAELLKVVADRALEILDPAVDQVSTITDRGVISLHVTDPDYVSPILSYLKLQKQFIAARLPVPLSAREEACSAAGAPHAVIYPYTALRMVRPGLATAVVEDGKVVVYHCMDNSRELFGTALSPVEFELDDGPAIEALLAAYPDSITVSDLEHPSEELDDKIGVAQALFKEGFLLITDEVSKPSVGPPPKKPAGAAAMTKNLKKRAGDEQDGKKKKRVQEPDDDDDPF